MSRRRPRSPEARPLERPGANASRRCRDGPLKVTFWFSSFMLATMILGVTLAGRPTRRGTLTLLFLGGTVGFMMWAYALYPAIFVHIS